MNALLALLPLIPELIQAVELLGKGFPGTGAIKKDLVLNAVRTVAKDAAEAGLIHGDGSPLLAGAAKLIDGYVAIYNATSIFRHEPREERN